MPILACQLPAHHLGKHVHRALTTQLHPWVGARHVPQLLSVLWAPPSSFVLTPYHVRHPSLSSQLQKSLLSSQQLPPLPSHALLLCSAISELLKAGSRQHVQQAVYAPVEAFHSASLPTRPKGLAAPYPYLRLPAKTSIPFIPSPSCQITQ